jgi:serine/threonine protein kinase
MNDSAAAKHQLSDVQERGAAGSTGIVLHDTYTLGSLIGQGGMGEVYEATHVRLPGRFAVKVLRPSLLTNQEAVSRFCREAEIMSALRHPHIIQIFDFNTSPEGLPYFVMEYLEGDDLETRLAHIGALSLVDLVRITTATASALSAAHALGIVHRDLKPSNIFLLRGEGQDNDFVKVIDFGISQIASSGRRLSQNSAVMGTPEFMAPEQALGLTNQLDARTDQFSLAGITYNMLTGREPFAGADPATLLYRVVHDQPPSLSTFFSWDTTAIQSVLDRALAKRREDRFDSIVDFASSLAAAADSMIRPPPSAVEPVRVPVVAHRRSVGPASVAPSLTSLDDQPPPVRRPRVILPARRAVQSLGDATDSRISDRIQHGPQRAIVLGLGVLGLAAAIVHNGWYREFPKHATQLEQGVVSFVRGEWRPRLASAADAFAREATHETAPTQVPDPVEIKSLPNAPHPSEVPDPSPALASDAVEAADEIGFPVQRAALRAERAPARPAHRYNRTFSRSGPESIEAPYRAPQSPSEISDTFSPPPRFSEPSLTPPPQTIPEGFPVPAPAPLPPGRDLAPAPSPSDQARPAADDPMPLP